MNELETPPQPEEAHSGEGQAAAVQPEAAVSMEELMAPSQEQLDASAALESAPLEDVQLRAVLEAIVYIAEEPMTVDQIADAIQQPEEHVQALLEQLVAEFDKPEHGIGIREVAGGYKMATKAEHHDTVRNFVKNLKPPLKLSLPALETLAVIAYKQPVTGPEVMAIRGVQGAGVFKTLLDRKLIAAAGRKDVIGKPMLYKTTKEFLIQFGLSDLNELPSLKEFEEIRRMALADDEQGPAEAGPVETAQSETPQAETVQAEEPAPPPKTAEAQEG
jgi:segregation and condensation protein B